jgi:hypothetical protein
MALRVLCLHDKNSCAPELIFRLKELGARLYQKHGIELAFANSPLISTVVTPSSSNDSKQPNETSDETKDHDSIGRVWYYENKSGLDASILHLRQLWQQSLYSAPFHIVMGIGQGAAMAAMLPFLTYEEGPNEESKLMFEGMKGCIFINGWDLLSSNNNDEEDIQKYEEVSNLSSLHIFNPDSQSSNILLQKYGDKAEFCTMENTKFNGKIFNAIGNFLVKRKNSQGQRSSLVLQTRNELAIVEEKALDMINQSVSANPPKALMAMITPDSSRGGTLFGGWIGNNKDEFRSEEFKESGGAPFPQGNQFNSTLSE